MRISLAALVGLAASACSASHPLGGDASVSDVGDIVDCGMPACVPATTDSSIDASSDADAAVACHESDP